MLMQLPEQFGELQIFALPHVITHITDAAEGSHARMFLDTGSNLHKLARDFFGIAYAESVRYHLEHPPFELHEDTVQEQQERDQFLLPLEHNDVQQPEMRRELTEEARAGLLESHRRFCLKPFLHCGVIRSLAERIVDELVLRDDTNSKPALN
jgi:hypothetical protein